ncbi:hypothetical protein B0H19DRAFT_1080432 [Mycena capillaripes]|nr:hypothetical protein B0H19DRAFT_1080432 [Mycena capillaripes]
MSTQPGHRDLNRVQDPPTIPSPQLVSSSEFPASEYWGVDMQVVYATNNTVILPQTAGIVETGSALIYLATTAYLQYKAIRKATLDVFTGLLAILSMKNLQTFILDMNGQLFPLIPNAQIWPRVLNAVIGGEADQIYLCRGPFRNSTRPRGTRERLHNLL